MSEQNIKPGLTKSHKDVVIKCKGGVLGNFTGKSHFTKTHKPLQRETQLHWNDTRASNPSITIIRFSKYLIHLLTDLPLTLKVIKGFDQQGG